MTMATQAVAEGFSDALEYILRAKLVGLELYKEHKEMSGQILKDLNKLTEFERELERRLNEQRSKTHNQDTGCLPV